MFYQVSNLTSRCTLCVANLTKASLFVKIRDTSVLVRLRPAWEELRGYLTARGRKRFEVYVCTMAERDYALEMWRLLDPDSNLINSKELLDRIVCVKSGKWHVLSIHSFYFVNDILYISDLPAFEIHDIYLCL